MNKSHQTNALKPAKFYALGFTLIELILVIVITGILAGMVAIFIKKPIEQYLDIANRAEMTDIADTALRRMGRDIRSAVPNSVRLSGNFLEFLPTKAGGRYRANNTGNLAGCGATGNELDFSTTDDCFEITGSAITFATGDYIVIGSTQSDGNPPYNNSSTGVLRAYTGLAGSQSKVIMAATQLPAFASLESQRFEVISGSDQAVTYACENIATVNGHGVGTLKRYSAYGFNTAQVAPPIGGISTLLADKISACSIVYNTVNQRSGLVAISLTITRNSESISLYHEIHLNNLP